MSSLQQTAISIIFAVFGGVWLSPLLPTPAEGGPYAFVTNPSVQFLLVFAGLSIMIHSTLSFVTSRVFGGPTRRTGVTVSSNPPETTLYSATIQYLDVLWNAEYGHSRGSESTHVEGPLCPACEVALDTQTERRYLLWESQNWYCPSCGFTTSNESPSDSLPRRSVENIVEVEGQKALADYAGADYVQPVSDDDRNYSVVGEDLNKREAKRITK